MTVNVCAATAPIGVTLFGGESGIPVSNIADTGVARARRAAAAGIDAVWFSQRYQYDAITLAGLIGREVPEITVGTSVVPILGRHPVLVSTQAQTV